MERLSDKFQIKKNELLKLYDELVSCEFIPFQGNGIKYDVNTISEIKSKLDSEQFIISIIGSIKSGKSTLLNYLIFGEEILPVDVAVATAVLTKIKYSEEKKAKVVFYSEDEWRQIKNILVSENGEEINYFNKYLKDSVNNSASKGIYDKEVIQIVPFCKELSDFKNLKSYISKDGEYSPFVSSVELEVPIEFIKGVEIVDTPGLNDPNELRSKITKDWIVNSNAVIYLMNSIQAYTNMDLNFIDKNLGFIDSSNIIFAITRIDDLTDAVGDSEVVRRYVENKIKNNEEFKKRELLQNEEVLMISTYAAMLNDKLIKEIELTSEEKVEKSKCPELVSKNGFIDEFQAKMSDQLMKDKGNAIVETNKTKIREFCDIKVRQLEIDLITKEKKKDAFALTIDEIESRKRNIKDIREKVDHLRKDTTKDIENQTIKIRNGISNYILEDIIKPSKKNFEEWIMDDDISATDAINLTGYQIKNYLSKYTGDLKDGLLLTSNFSDKMEEIKTELEKNIKEITKKEFSSRATKFYTNTADISSLIDKLLALTKKDLNEKMLSDLRDRVWGFLWTKKIKTKQNILKKVDDELDEISAQIRNYINPVIKTDIMDYFKKIFDDVESLLTNFNDSYSQVENVQGDKEKQLKIVENEITIVEKDKVKFKKYSDEINSKLNNI